MHKRILVLLSVVALMATLLATLIVVYATMAPPAQASDAIGVEVVADTLTTAPPGTLGGYSMTPFAPDSRPLFEDVSTVPAPQGRTLQFDLPMNHRTLENGWASNWGHGYLGDVYFSNFSDQVVMTLPANTHAFYLHAQPNNRGTYTVTATADDGTTSGPIPVTVGFPGDQTSSAAFFGFYSKDGTALNTIKVEVPTEVDGLGIGEFGIETDTTPPSVEVVSPDDGETDVAPTANVTATFSEQVQGVTTRTFKLERVVVNKKGVEQLRKIRARLTTVVVGPDTPFSVTEARLNPANDLPSGEYQVTVTTGVTDLAGNPLDQDPIQTGNQPKVWTFTVGSPPV